MYEPITFKGKKAAIVKEDDNSVYIIALEDNVFESVHGRLSYMTASRVYRFCRCCFESHCREVAK